MRKVLSFVFLIVLVFFSGCIEQLIQPSGSQGPSYSNDMITIEDYHVSVLNPYSGSATSIEFLVQNNVDRTIKNVEVDFFNIPGGFTITSIRCGNIECPGSPGCPSEIPTNCTFSEIRSLDNKKVRINLKAPDVSIETPITINYQVRYPAEGGRTVTIPIIDTSILTEPVIKYSESSSMYSPVLVDFEPPIGRITKKEKETIKEYWGTKNTPFELRLKFKNVGTEGQRDEINISKDNIKMTLSDNIKVDSNLPCMFEPSSITPPQSCGDNCKGENIRLSVRQGRDVDTLVCNFVNAEGFTTSQILATITVTYNFEYKFIKSETFKIIPKSE